MNVKSQSVDRAMSQTESLDGRSRVKAAPTTGAVRFQSIAGDVRQAPRSGTKQGKRALADHVRHTLDRVRRNIRERASRDTGQ